MPHTTHLAQEIATQPDDWERVVGRLDDVARHLPRPGERVATIGCGTSWFMGQAYAVRREQLGQGSTDAYAASEHHLARGYDRVVLISRSGTTTEVMAVVEELRAAGTPHVSFVATAGTPVAERSDATVLLDDVDEQSVVQTRFATTTLALLRASLGEDLGPGGRAGPRGARRGRRDGIRPPRRRGAGDLPRPGVDQRDRERGCAQAARVGAVLVRVLPGDGVPPRADQHRRAGAGRVGVRRGAGGAARAGRATGARFEHRDIDPLADLVRLHRLCLGKADAAGLDPDAPRNLTRSIVLT